MLRWIQHICASLKVGALYFQELLLKIHQHLGLLDLKIHELFHVNLLLLCLFLGFDLILASLLGMLRV